ncbi:hypothetical protein L6R52_14485 [Myxococcota bacterium]|nr:hypothetical protein [Myxococcota bacterium]
MLALWPPIPPAPPLAPQVEKPAVPPKPLPLQPSQPVVPGPPVFPAAPSVPRLPFEPAAPLPAVIVQLRICSCAVELVMSTPIELLPGVVALPAMIVRRSRIVLDVMFAAVTPMFDVLTMLVTFVGLRAQFALAL